MNVRQTRLMDALVLTTERHLDERGAFARLICHDEFSRLGLPYPFLQSSLSHTRECATLRGMHFQRSPSLEGKLVRCLRGRIWDVIVDLRIDSPTFCQHHSLELAGDTLDAIWVPPGFAHGYLTLGPDCLVQYHMTDVYRPDLSAGVRWNDPLLRIDWPSTPRFINDRDATFTDFEPIHADVPTRSQSLSA